MAGGAAASSVEERLAACGVSYQDVSDLVGAAVCSRRDLAVQKSRDIGDLLRRQCERGHAAGGTSVPQELAELLAAFIVEHQNRAKQIGTALAPSGARAVAKAARGGEHGPAAVNRRLSVLWDLAVLRPQTHCACR